MRDFAVQLAERLQAYEFDSEEARALIACIKNRMRWSPEEPKQPEGTAIEEMDQYLSRPAVRASLVAKHDIDLFHLRQDHNSLLSATATGAKSLKREVDELKAEVKALTDAFRKTSELNDRKFATLGKRTSRRR